MQIQEFKNLNLKEKLKLVKQGKKLDIFINDSNWRVRQSVAEMGYGLYIPINDQDWRVRESALNQVDEYEELNNNKESITENVNKQLKLDLN